MTSCNDSPPPCSGVCSAVETATDGAPVLVVLGSKGNDTISVSYPKADIDSVKRALVEVFNKRRMAKQLDGQTRAPAIA